MTITERNVDNVISIMFRQKYAPERQKGKQLVNTCIQTDRGTHTHTHTHTYTHAHVRTANYNSVIYYYD